MWFWFLVLSVKVPALALNGELILIILNKQTLPLWISEKHLSVLFYATSSLVPKSVLIEWCWDCYRLTGLISSFFRILMKISQFFSHFGIFIANKEEGISQISLRIFSKKKIQQSIVWMCTHRALLYYPYNVMFFWGLFTFLICFYEPCLGS